MNEQRGVFKCGFYDFWGMVGPTDQESTAIEKIIRIDLERRAHTGDGQGGTRVSQQARGVGGNWGRNLYHGFHRKEQMRQQQKA